MCIILIAIVSFRNLLIAIVVLYNFLFVLFQSGRKETVLDLAKFVDKGVQVKLTGDRQGVSYNLFLSGLDILKSRPIWAAFKSCDKI